jgi:hypothetical protein
VGLFLCLLRGLRPQQRKQSFLWFVLCAMLARMSDQDKRFLGHLNADDPLQIIVRGHLYVDAELMKLIYEALPEPEAIDLTRLAFPARVDLAVAMGLFWSDEKPAYLFLNKLRNKLSHNLDAEVSRSEELEFFNTLGPRQRFAFGDKGPDSYASPRPAATDHSRSIRFDGGNFEEADRRQGGNGKT